MAAISFTITNDSTISAVSPAGTGTVDVTVTTAGGASATSSADQFTYTSGASLAAYGVSGSAQTTTGSIVSGSNQLALASALDFKNGEGITISGAGPQGGPLNSTIVSGAGSTTLTLSATAATSVAGSTVMHNDTLAIQSCLSKVPSGSTVLFPNGQYNIDAAIQIPSNIVINLQKDAIVYLMDNSNTDVFQLNDVQNVEIDGGILNGNSSKQTFRYDQNAFCGIDIINGSTNITINDVEITATAAMAIASNPVSDSDVSNVTITNCYIHDLGNQAGAGHGIEMANGTTGAVVENNLITNNVAYGLYAIDADNVTFQDNTIENVLDGIVYESGTVATSRETDVKSIGNTISNAEDGIHVEYNNGSVEGNTFEDNSLDNITRLGIYENYSAGDVIDGNKITGVDGSPYGAGISIGTAYNGGNAMTEVSNNQIWDCPAAGITGNDNITISDNKIWNTTTPPSIMGIGMLFENSNNLVIQGNTITGMNIYGILADYNDSDLQLIDNVSTGVPDGNDYDIGASYVSVNNGNTGGGNL
jgi:hypothetical protein